MRLLFVTPYFPPTAGSGVQRGAKFVKYLLRAGWDVRVVTIDPGAYPDEDPELAAEVEDAPVTIAGRSRMPGVEQTVLRALPGMRTAIGREMRDHRPDVVLATTPDYHWTLVAEVALRRRIPFALDYPDPWTVLPEDFRTSSGPTKLKSKAKWATAPQVEQRLLDRAAFATFATELIQREYVLARYLSAKKAHVLENGFDEEDFAGLRSSAPEGVIRVSHVGSFAGGRTPLRAARAVARAAELRPDLSFELELIGSGVEEHVRELESALGEIPLRLRGWVSHGDAVRAMCSATVLWLDATTSLRWSSPAKVYEYLRSGRPILGLTRSDAPAAQLIRRFQAGIALDTEDAEAAGAALVELGTSFPRPRDPEELSYYSSEALAARLSDLLTSAIG